MKILKKALSLVVAFLLAFGMAGAQVSYAAMDTRTLAMVNKPGVVLVQTVWTANITWYEFAFQPELEDFLVDTVNELIDSGIIENTDQAAYRAMVQLMTENMKYYAFITGNANTEQASAAAVGTGFIVTPDGYMVTNAHVVETNEEQLYTNFARNALNDYAVQGTNAFAAEMRRSGYQMNQTEWENLANAYYDLLAQTMEVSNLQTRYWGYIGNVTPGSDVSARGVALDVRKVGESTPGKDIAILKMDLTNLPTVTLGNDEDLRTGDPVYAMGYPAVATLSGTLNVSQAIQEPTLTQGIISARKQMAGGWSILQTDADIHGGNSGGPLFNADGEVIGVNTFGMIDPDTGVDVSGINFAIPISIAKQFLNEINVTPTESDFTRRFKEAKAFFDAENYSEALRLLRNLNETNPGFPVVADLLAQSALMEINQPAATDPPVTAPPITMPEATPAPTEPVRAGLFAASNLPIIIIGSVVILLLIAVVVVLLLRKKNPQPSSGDRIQGGGGPGGGPSAGPPISPISPIGRSAPSAHEPVHDHDHDHAHDHDHPHDHASEAEKKGSFCANCGAALAPGTKFCPNCGTEHKE